MINMSWKRFLLLQVPCMALALALVAQVLAFSLSSVPMRRDRPDELALAVSEDPTEYRTLLFGDSTTRNATARFSLGAPGEVGNLATNGYIGLSGSLFLLQRYLKTHPSPEHVVFALSPRMYHRENDPRLARYHLWHTFNEPEERKFLEQYVPGIAVRDWLPAVLDVQERIVEPFLSLIKQRYLAFRKTDDARFNTGVRSASPQAPVEFAARDETAGVDRTQVLSGRRDLSIAPVNAEALNRLCSLSKAHGFRVELAWSPIPSQLEHILTSSGALQSLESEIKSIMDEGRCDFAGFVDFNKMRSYPNLSFHNDMLHLFGDGWEQRYTSDIRDYLSGLLHPNRSNAVQ